MIVRRLVRALKWLAVAIVVAAAVLSVYVATYWDRTSEDIGAIYEFLRTLPPSGQPAPDDPQVKQ